MRLTRWSLLPALGLLIGLVGCNNDLGSLAYFLMPEPKEPPEIKKLASDDKKKIVKVVILPYVNLDIAQTEFLGADAQVAEAFAKEMRLQAADNQEQLDVVPWLKVKEYLTRRPNWRADFDPLVVGKDFKADYVVIVDIHKLSLYEPNSFHQLYRGQMDLTVTLVDVKKPDETAEQRDMNFLYPTEARDPVELDTPANAFKTRFFAEVGKKLTWNFVPHRKREAYTVE